MSKHAEPHAKHAGLRATIARDLPDLAPAQRRLAHFLLDHLDSASDYTITDLAEVAGVSIGTVSQLSRRFGLRGYQDLRLTLAREAVLAESIGAAEFLDDHDGSEAGGIRSALRRVFGANAEAIKETARRIDLGAFATAAEALANARRIECVGIATAALVAAEAALKWRKLGFTALAHADSHAAAMSVATLEPTDILMVVSHSGRTVDTVHCATLARGRGAKVIAITGSSRSPLGKVADLVLETFSYDTGFQIEPMASTIAELSVVQALFVVLLERDPERTEASLSRTQHATEERHIRGRVS